MKRRALITGITGQDGSYLAEFLLEKDYEVYGMVRRSSSPTLSRIFHLLDRVKLVEGDLSDDASLRRCLAVSKPQEVYNLAAQSQVGISFLEPIHTSEVTGIGALRLYEAVRLYTSLSEGVRLYQASSSEMFGNAPTSPQTELTPMRPVSPYGCAKLFAHSMAQTYRASYGMFIACGIAYNHESPRRGEEFVTRKITRVAAMIAAGAPMKLTLGNIDARRDWSHAKDIVRGMWLLLQHSTPLDCILASGTSTSVQEFYQKVFACLHLNPSVHVELQTALRRPTEIAQLVGDTTLARTTLGWTPTYTLDTLIKEMVDAELATFGLSDPRPPEGSAPLAPSAWFDRAADVSP